MVLADARSYWRELYVGWKLEGLRLQPIMIDMGPVP